MKTVIISGAGGLVGSTAALFYGQRGFHVVGLDNDMRRRFFGDGASTRPRLAELTQVLPDFTPCDLDVRDEAGVGRVFAEHGDDTDLVIHTAAQPSHDWAAREPQTDFAVNANGTLNLLEATRRHCPEAVFIFTSTNKVYGDRPNQLPFVELDTRWEIAPGHPYHDRGIDEAMPVDQCLHSLFGASKLAADVLVQEYGRYFGLKTGVFRAGCLTGPAHAAAELHGFLAWLVQCAVTGATYHIYGYGGKQVRDNLHSADLVQAFHEFHLAPRPAEVYNIGGSRFANCSLLEAAQLTEEITGHRLATVYCDQPRVGDHIWWISDTTKFRSHYPNWQPTHTIGDIIAQIHEALQARAQAEQSGRCDDAR
ncbi:MAG: NAD-dependent epimerase/dehydratase family protein [Armatimonadetes bacterium]|nr:NAD-dependent epimerase/dehydratase family protein [Armatimonadota bacterium]